MNSKLNPGEVVIMLTRDIEVWSSGGDLRPDAKQRVVWRAVKGTIGLLETNSDLPFLVVRGESLIDATVPMRTFADLENIGYVELTDNCANCLGDGTNWWRDDDEQDTPCDICGGWGVVPNGDETLVNKP